MELTTAEHQRLLHHRLVQLGAVEARAFVDESNGRLWVRGFICPALDRETGVPAPLRWDVTPKGIDALGRVDVLARIAAIAMRFADTRTLPESQPGAYDSGRALMAWRALRGALDELRRSRCSSSVFSPELRAVLDELRKGGA